MACAGPEPQDDRVDSADTAADPDPAVDADGDGAPAWDGRGDPTAADCDDQDPAVNPTTEVLVPAGPFARGSTEAEWATPVTEVELSAYCVDRLEVTHGDFLAFLQYQEARGHSNTDDQGQPLYSLEDLVSPDTYPSRYTYDAGVWTVDPAYADHPVTEVWWTGAQAYCAWGGKALPTEAQWEKAARGDDGRTYPWGDEPPTCEHAAYSRLAEQPDEEPPGCVDMTVPVGSYPDGASPYGALDMAGNASEWVADWFSPTAYEDPDRSDPTGPAEGQLFDDGVGQYIARCARGGPWRMPEEYLRTFSRVPEPEGATSNGIGFRCARSLAAG